MMFISFESGRCNRRRMGAPMMKYVRFKEVRKVVAGVGVVLLLSGCAGMSRTEQRVLSGGAIGAASGAALGAITGGSPAVGAAIGGAAGAVGGLIVDSVEKHR
jgi:hypothetical protein